MSSIIHLKNERKTRRHINICVTGSKEREKKRRKNISMNYCVYIDHKDRYKKKRQETIFIYEKLEIIERISNSI